MDKQSSKQHPLMSSTINPEDIDFGRMIDMINTFEAATMELEEFPPGKEMVYYFRTKPEDLQVIRARLTAVAPIVWTESSEAQGCGEFPGPRSQISLRRDLDIAIPTKPMRR